MKKVHFSSELMHCKRPTCILYALTVYSGGGGGNGISSDGADRSRIFLSLKFSIRGFLVVGKFGKYLFFEGREG